MPTTVARNPWSEILHHENEHILELRWLPSTRMTDGAFKATLALFAWEAEKSRPAFLLVDALHFRHEPGEGVNRWRDDHIMPRYGAAGTRKFAMIVPEGVPDTVESGSKPEPEGEAVFLTAWFSSREHALQWFREG